MSKPRVWMGTEDIDDDPTPCEVVSMVGLPAGTKINCLAGDRGPIRAYAIVHYSTWKLVNMAEITSFGIGALGEDGFIYDLGPRRRAWELFDGDGDDA